MLLQTAANGNQHVVPIAYVQSVVMIVGIVVPVAIAFLSLKILSTSNALKLEIKKEMEKVSEKLAASQLSFGLLNQQVQAIEKHQLSIDVDFKVIRKRCDDLQHVLATYLLQKPCVLLSAIKRNIDVGEIKQVLERVNSSDPVNGD
jgi:hypothetical protein